MVTNLPIFTSSKDSSSRCFAACYCDGWILAGNACSKKV